MAANRKASRTRINDPAGMRSKILDAAAELFQSNGYNDTSTLDIVKAAEVTSGALHHHFPTKKSLGLAVLKERVATAVHDSWIAPVLKAKTAIGGIGTAFDNIGGSLRAQGFVRGCPLNNLTIELAYSDADFRSEAELVFREWQSAIAGRLEEQLQGRGQAADAADLAAFVIATYSGAIAMAKVQQSSVPIEAAWRRLQRFLERELKDA